MLNVKTISTVRRFGAVALFTLMLFAAVIPANALVIVDVSGDLIAQGNNVITALLYIGAAAALGGLIFGAIKLGGRDIASGVIAILGSIVALIFIGHALGWTSALTGVTVGGG